MNKPTSVVDATLLVVVATEVANIAAAVALPPSLVALLVPHEDLSVHTVLVGLAAPLVENITAGRAADLAVVIHVLIIPLSTKSRLNIRTPILKGVNPSLEADARIQRTGRPERQCVVTNVVRRTIFLINVTKKGTENTLHLVDTSVPQLQVPPITSFQLTPQRTNLVTTLQVHQHLWHRLLLRTNAH